MPLGTLLSGGKAHHLLQKCELDPLPPVCLEKAVLHPLYSVSPSPSALPNEASVEKPAEYIDTGIHEALTQIGLGRGSQWPGPGRRQPEEWYHPLWLHNHLGARFWDSQLQQDKATLGFQDDRGWGLTYCVPLRDRHCPPRLMCSDWPGGGPRSLRPWHLRVRSKDRQIFLHTSHKCLVKIRI